MLDELLSLFREGGGKQATLKYIVHRSESVAPGQSPLEHILSGDSPYWTGVAMTLSKMEEVQNVVATALAGALMEREGDLEPDVDMNKRNELVKQATDFVQSRSDDIQQAAQVLLSAEDRLQGKFGITPWDAYWEILYRAFRTHASPLGLSDSLINAIDDNAA